MIPLTRAKGRFDDREIMEIESVPAMRQHPGTWPDPVRGTDVDDSKSLGEMNAEVCEPHTKPDIPAEGGPLFHRALLTIPSKGDYWWWSCMHRHSTQEEAQACADAAHEQMRQGLSTHRLTGLDAI